MKTQRPRQLLTPFRAKKRSERSFADKGLARMRFQMALQGNRPLEYPPMTDS